MHETDLDQFTDTIKDLVMEGAHTLRPDQDVPACAFVELAPGLVAAVPTPGGLDDETAGLLVRAAGAEKFGHMATIWLTDARGRREAVMVVTHDAEDSRAWINDLERLDDGPPRFCGWYTYPGVAVGGPLADAVKAAMR